MRDASGMIGRKKARAASHRVLPCVSEIQSECTGKERELGRPWRSIRSITAHSHDLCRELGAFGGTGELHLLLDRCVGQRARGTCCPPFLRFDNRVNGEWAEQKGRRSSYGVAHLSCAGDWRMGRVNSPGADKRRNFVCWYCLSDWKGYEVTKSKVPKVWFCKKERRLSEGDLRLEK